MVAVLREQCSQFPDKRTGENSQYELPDAGMSAFSVFFTQTPSFLAHQRDMQLRKGKSNAERLFALDELPSDNQIRNLLDSRAAAESGSDVSVYFRSRGTRRTVGRVSFLWQAPPGGHGWDGILQFAEDPLRAVQPSGVE